MAAQIPDTEPNVIQAGDTIAWTKSIDDYPANDGWSLSYKLINEHANYDISSVADGSGYSITVTAATTADFAPGAYSLLAWVTKGAERYSLETKSVEILPDRAAMTKGHDNRLTAEIVLEALDIAMREHGASAWTHSYTIQGRSMTFTSPKDFMDYRALLRAEISREKGVLARKQGKKSRNYIQFRI